jgi:hypothetical protein
LLGRLRFGGSGKVADANDPGDVHLVVLVPAIPAGLLRHAMAGIGRPCLQFLFVFPPDDGQPLAVISREALHLDESGKGSGMRRHRVRHAGVVVAGLGREP